MLTRALPFARALGADRRGVAMVEFAYSLPVVVALALGGLEVTSLALAHLRVNQVAVTTADNAARVIAQMDETDIEEIFAGAQSTGRALGIEDNGRIVLSSLQDNGRPGTARGQMINWQRCYGRHSAAPRYGRENHGRNDAAMRNGMGPPGRQIAAAPGTAVMFVEVTYNHRPVVFGALTGPIEIQYETAFNVRERTELGITNTRGRQRRTC